MGEVKLNLIFSDSDTGDEFYPYIVKTPLTKEELSSLLYKSDKILLMADDYSTAASLMEDYKERSGENLPLEVAEVARGLLGDVGHNPEGLIEIVTAFSRETTFIEDKKKFDLEVTINC